VRLIVTGAAGMLGHDVLAAARAAGHDVTALTRAELDLTDGPATISAVGALRPDAVVNCAAYTDVDGAESDEAAADAGNSAAPANLAAACCSAGARFVHVSTDYVFDGDRPPDAPAYVESDPTAPLGAYGRSKLRGEHSVAEACHDHAIVRTAWLFGTHGKNFVATILRAARERGALEVVTDQVGSPTFSGHLAPALVAMAARDERGTFHGAGTGRCSWHELASEAIAQAGIQAEVAPVTSERFPRPAPRPAFSVLGSQWPQPIALPDWRDGVRDFLAEATAAGVAA
jgi:dTDP-4-dehydrorhamnose reductase